MTPARAAKPKLRDREIREAVLANARFVAGVKPEVEGLLVEELATGGPWVTGDGSARADVAVLTEDEFVGIEIKSDVDSSTRLQGQARCYDAFFDRRVLVTKPERFERWGSYGWRQIGYEAGDAGRITLFETEYETGERRRRDEWLTSISVAPGLLLSTLWSAEIKRLTTRLIQARRCPQFPIMRGRDAMIRRCAAALSIRECRIEVMAVLRARMSGGGVRFGGSAKGSTAAKVLS